MSTATTRGRIDGALVRLALVGVVLLAAIAGGVVAILSAFTGHFASYDVVYADVPASGNGISSGSVVIFRDITVGTVAGLGHLLPGGILHAELHIMPADLKEIPAGVKADVEIATVFGTQGINLVAPSTSGRAHLSRGQTIGSVSSSKTTTLQGDATDLDNVLKALHPASLDAALTAIATALAGRGHALGSTIASASTYLSEMLPHLPTVENDLGLLGPLAGALSVDAPPLISALKNGSVTAGTITAESGLLHQLLSNGTPLADDLTRLLSGVQSPFDDLVANSAPLLADVAQNPHEIAQILSGLDSWSKGFATAESQGPFLSFSGDLLIAGSAQLVLAALGLPGSNALIEQGLGQANFNPTTYTAADCPTYGSLRGPTCPAASPVASPAARSAAVVPGSVTTTAEQQAALKIATGINGGKRPPEPAVVTLLLEPLLDRLAGPS